MSHFPEVSGHTTIDRFNFFEPINVSFFKWQYRAGAGAKIMGKVEPELELEPKLNNFGSVTLVKISYYVPLNKLYFTPY